MKRRQPRSTLFPYTTLFRSKNKEQSVANMKRAIELNPKNAAALNYLGYTWAEMGVRLDEAEQLIQRSEEHTSELQSLAYLVCRLLLEKKKKTKRSVCLKNRN